MDPHIDIRSSHHVSAPSRSREPLRRAVPRRRAGALVATAAVVTASLALAGVAEIIRSIA